MIEHEMIEWDRVNDGDTIIDQNDVVWHVFRDPVDPYQLALCRPDVPVVYGQPHRHLRVRRLQRGRITMAVRAFEAMGFTVDRIPERRVPSWLAPH